MSMGTCMISYYNVTVKVFLCEKTVQEIMSLPFRIEFGCRSRNITDTDVCTYVFQSLIGWSRYGKSMCLPLWQCRRHIEATKSDAVLRSRKKH